MLESGRARHRNLGFALQILNLQLPVASMYRVAGPGYLWLGFGAAPPARHVPAGNRADEPRCCSI